MLRQPLFWPGLICLIVALLAPQWLGTYGTGVGLQLLGWIALTSSWVAFSGMTGYISLGHAVFYGLGGYTMALLWMVWPLWAILPLAGLVAAVLAAVAGLPSLRVRGPYFVILTFGLAEFVKYVVVATESALGSSGRLLIGTPATGTLYYLMLGLAVAAVGLTIWIGRSRLGVALRAIREDETAAATLGVPTTRAKLIAFVLSAVIPGMVGAVAALRTTYFEPMHLFSPMTSFTIVTMAIIGGSDKPAGPILGAAFIMLLSETLWSRAPELYMVILGVLLIIFVLSAPGGLYGKLAGLRWPFRRSHRS